ncbi:MAG TPA: sigma-70 family RNA polymerase sigma factor [Acidimicrobiales bacterium]|nr:sigma-70 family RNA polymerase sigma factor [Acidimicrobiales bacterium]
MAVATQSVRGLTSLDDGNLVQAYGEGHAGAFDELFRRYAPMSWRLSTAVLGLAEPAVEAVVAAFAWLLTPVPSDQLSDADHVRPALLSATRDACLDTLHRGDHLDASAAHPDASGEEEVRLEEVIQGGTSELQSGHSSLALASPALAGALQDLPERWRSVLWLTDVEGLPIAETARIMGTTPAASSRLVDRARSAFAERCRQGELAREDLDPACRATIELLEGQRSTPLPAGADSEVARHVGRCRTCSDQLALAEDPGAALRAELVPLPVAELSEAAAQAHLADRERLPLLAAFSERARKPLASASLGVLALGIIGATLTNLSLQGPPSSGSLAVPQFPWLPPTVVQRAVAAPVASHSSLFASHRRAHTLAAPADSLASFHAPAGRHPGSATTSSSTTHQVVGTQGTAPSGGQGSSPPPSGSGGGGSPTPTNPTSPSVPLPSLPAPPLPAAPLPPPTGLPTPSLPAPTVSATVPLPAVGSTSVKIGSSPSVQVGSTSSPSSTTSPSSTSSPSSTDPPSSVTPSTTGSPISVQDAGSTAVQAASCTAKKVGLVTMGCETPTT